MRQTSPWFENLDFIMRIPSSTPAILCALLLVVAGCRSDGEPPSESRVQVLEAPPQTLTVENSVDKERSEARYVTWPDSSLGCPQSDFGYMQVLTPGILVVLQHGGSSYHYHGAREGLPFYCEQPRQPVDGHTDEATY
jgi:hypothetical protein